MKLLVQEFEDQDGDYIPGSVRIAVVTDEPHGKCHICGCLLYASAAWEPSGAQVFTRTLGKHKGGCELRPMTPVRTRSVK